MEPITPVVLPRPTSDAIKTGARRDMGALGGMAGISGLVGFAGLGASPAADAAEVSPQLARTATPTKDSSVVNTRTVSAKMDLGTQPAVAKETIPSAPVAKAMQTSQDTTTGQFVLPEPGVPLALLAVFLVMLLIGKRRAHKTLRIVSGDR